MLQITSQEVPLIRDPDGVLVVRGTRVTLHSLVGMFGEGASAEEIAHEYDSLDLSDVYAILTYYLRNRQGVDAELGSEERRAEEAAGQFEKRLPDDLRRRLTEGRQLLRGG